MYVDHFHGTPIKALAFRSFKVIISMFGSRADAFESDMLIEGFVVVREGMDHQAPDADDVYSLNNPIPCVTNQGAAYPLALE